MGFQLCGGSREGRRFKQHHTDGGTRGNNTKLDGAEKEGVCSFRGFFKQKDINSIKKRTCQAVDGPAIQGKPIFGGQKIQAGSGKTNTGQYQPAGEFSPI